LNIRNYIFFIFRVNEFLELWNPILIQSNKEFIILIIEFCLAESLFSDEIVYYPFDDVSCR